MKVVGITQRDLPPTEFGEYRYGLDARWYEFLAACGVVAVPLPNDATLSVRTATELGLDGIVLSGGHDLARYGGTAPARDEAEGAVLRWAVSREVPVLGVCRGMQLILDAFGARLVPVPGHVAVRHRVELAGGGHREVNSYHRWAALETPPALIPVAVCGDVVEQVQHADARVTGVMWHPEREAEFSPADLRLVRDLLGIRR